MSESVIQYAVRTFELDIHGDHGMRHWVSVYKNALLLAESTPCDRHLLWWFAMLHDVGRLNESHDPHHGERGAHMIETDLADVLQSELSRDQTDILLTAIEGHNKGMVSPDPTIGVCWDADRLDLIRYCIDPVPALMSTRAARRACEGIQGLGVEMGYVEAKFPQSGAQEV